MSLKTVIHRALRRAGFQVRRVSNGMEVTRVDPLLRGSADRTCVVDVAGTPLEMHAATYLAQIYKAFPDYNAEIGRLVGHLVTADPTVAMIDIGASYGDTVAIAKRAANISVLCFEGDARTLSLSRGNLSRFSRVKLVETLLGERTETIRARAENDGGNLRLVPVETAADEVRVRALDDEMATIADAARYRILKIDTEGFDCRILRGGLNFIRRVKPAIAMEWHVTNMQRIGEPGLPTLELLRSAGYSMLLVYDNGGRFILSTTLDNPGLIADLHAYAARGAIQYYDFILFHGDDTAAGLGFVDTEREHLRRQS